MPEDLSVVGFDDIPLAPYIVPPLTTIRQDVVAWGAAAAETLVAAVEGRERPALSLPPVDFVVRGSTGRARSQPKHWTGAAVGTTVPTASPLARECPMNGGRAAVFLSCSRG